MYVRLLKQTGRKHNQQETELNTKIMRKTGMIEVRKEERVGIVA